MKIVAFSLTWWQNEEQAKARASELIRWEKHLCQLAHVSNLFLVSGTYSPPSPHTDWWEIVQAEVKNQGIYTPCTSYCLCAASLALAHALTNYSFDLLLHLSTDCVCGHDLRPYAEELMRRPELIMASNFGPLALEDSVYLLKREGIPVFLNNRKRANFLPETKDYTKVLLPEMEMAQIFDSKWWNYWPTDSTWRRDDPHWKNVTDDEVVAKWPLVLRPSPELRAKYLKARFP